MENIITTRLKLVPIQIKDTIFIKKLFMDSDVKKFYVLREDHKKNMDSFVQYLIQTTQAKSGLNYIVMTKNDIPIGLVGGELRRNEDYGIFWNNSYAILPEYRNNGYATEAIIGFSKYLMHLNIETAILDISEYNEASKSVARKAGYKESIQCGFTDFEHPELGLIFNWILQLHSKRDVYFAKAMMAFQSKDYRSTESLLQQALEHDNSSNGPNTDALCYSNMGMACSGYGNYIKAYQCLMKAKSLGLNNASIEKELNWLRINKGIG